MTTPWTPSLVLPAKWRHLTEEHPTTLVESANMAATAPPTTSYRPRCVPSNISRAQAEAALLALNALRLSSHRGFCLGDATGVGKGRTIAAIIMDYMVDGNGIVVWVTSSKSLFEDAKRDLAVVAGQDVCDAMLDSGGGGTVILHTYRSLMQNHTVATLTARLHEAADRALIVFDEAHAARNITSSRSAKAVAEMQRVLPRCGVVYSTATPASDVDRILYMSRLGLWARSDSASEEQSARKYAADMSKRGPAALELLSLHLKRQGLYVARMLPDPQASARIIECRLSDAQRTLYDFCVFSIAASSGHPQTNCYQPFFRKLITSFKAEHILHRARAHIAAGRSVLVTLQGTGDAAARRGGGGALLQAFRAMCGDDAIEDPGFPLEPMQLLHEGLSEFGVVEVSGRRHVAVRDSVRKFQNGEARVLVATAAGAHGLSLHDTSRGDAPTRRRVHMILELPWSAETFVQQCGRSSRTGQRTAPMYEIVISDVPAEARFSCTVLRRLRQLSAITYADRRTGSRCTREMCGASFVDDTAYPRAAVRLLLCRSVREACRLRGVSLNADAVSVADANVCVDYLHREMTASQRNAVSSLRHLHGPCADFTARCLLDAGLTSCRISLLRAASHTIRRTERCRGGVGYLQQYSYAFDHWTPENHCAHTREIQDVACTLLLCAQRAECPLSILPREILLGVVGTSVGDKAELYGVDSAVLSAAQALRALHKDSIGEALQGATTTALMNWMLCMPLEAQTGMRGVIRQAADLTQLRRQARGAGTEGYSQALSLEAYVCGKDNTEDVICRAVGGPPDERGIRNLVVSCRHAPPPTDWSEWIASWPLGAHEVGYTGSGSPYTIVRNAASEYEVYYPGRAKPKSRHALLDRARALAFRGGAPVTLPPNTQWATEWREVASRYTRARAERVSAYSRTLRIATDTALDLWEESTGQVLKCLPPVTKHRFTCLVIRSSV